MQRYKTHITMPFPRRGMLVVATLLITGLALIHPRGATAQKDEGHGPAVVALATFRPVAAKDRTPFKGSFEGTVTRSLPPPPISVYVDAAGNATHLGQFTVDIPHTVTPPNGVGEYHFVSANGDTLTAEFTGLSSLVAPGFLYILETATITGGTGRFANASGDFVCERLYDIAAGTTTGTFDGSISYTDR